MVEKENLYWQVRHDEEEEDWRYSGFSHSINGEIFIDYLCSYSSSEDSQALDIRVRQKEDELGRALYDGDGFWLRVEVYPLTIGYQNYLREFREDSLVRLALTEEDFERVTERTQELLKLHLSSFLQIEPRLEKDFFQVKGVLNPMTEEKVDLGSVESGEMFWWDEYYYRITGEENKLTVEVRSPLEGKPLKKRLVFPLEIDYDQVFELFTNNDADDGQIPQLIPVEVDFPAAAETS